MAMPSGLRTKEPPKVPTTEMEWLKQIEEHLRSLRSMVKFFVVITVLAIIVQVLTVLLNFGR